jgi:hypothetical protein
MSCFTEYAEKADLAEYLNVDVSKITTGYERLLSRASELVKASTHDNIDESNTIHMELAKLATCAQVEYWLNTSESPDIPKEKGKATNIKLCYRSMRYLLERGLLYSGIKSYTIYNDDTTN